MEESLRDIEDQIKSQTHILKESRREQGEWRRDNVETIIEKLFQIYMSVNYQIQAVRVISNMINTIESTPRHIILKLHNTKFF